MTRLEAAFKIFHQDNPQVYAMFKKFAHKAFASGRLHFGVAAVWERLRWEVAIETNDEEFKLNNNHRAYYARMFMRDFPKTDGFFRTRAVRGGK